MKGYTPSCIVCGSPCTDAELALASGDPSLENWEAIFICPSGSYHPICNKCIFTILIRKYGFEAPPSSRKRVVQGAKLIRQKEGEKGKMINEEMLSGAWIKADQLGPKGHVDEIAEASIDDTGKFGTRVTVQLKKGVGSSTALSLNKTSLRLCVDAWGKNEVKFVGKKIRLTKAVVNGKDCVMAQPA